MKLQRTLITLAAERRERNQALCNAAENVIIAGAVMFLWVAIFGAAGWL